MQRSDALPDPAPIYLELALARAARSDPAAEPGEVGAGTDQIRLTITQLRQLDRKLSFAAARVAGEDVENQHRPIYDRQRNDRLEVLALPRPQIVEHEEQIGRFVLGSLGDLVRLSAADERRRVGRIAPLNDAFDNPRPRGARQRFELGELRLEAVVQRTRLDRHNQRALHQRSGSMRLGADDRTASGPRRCSAAPGAREDPSRSRRRGAA